MRDGFKGSRAVVLPESIIEETEQDPFGSNLHITDIGHYPSAHLHHRTRKEGAAQHILIYCVSGSGWIELCGTKHTLKKDQLLIIPAHAPHSYGADKTDPWSIYWVHFKGHLADFYTRGLDRPTAIDSNGQSRNFDRIAVFEEMLNSLEKGYNKEQINFAISALYYFLGSIKYGSQYRASAIDHQANRSVVDKAIIYMKEHMEDKVTVSDLCQYVGFSDSHFVRLFKSVTGYSPINYMIQLKMQHACDLLRFTEMRVNQICHKVGIDNPYYFSRLFKTRFGLSPNQYKEQMRGAVKPQQSEGRCDLLSKLYL